MKTTLHNLPTLLFLLIGLLFLFGSVNASICCNCSGPHCTSSCVEDPNANSCGTRGECSSEACTPPAFGIRMEGEASFMQMQKRVGKHVGSEAVKREAKDRAVLA